MFCYQTEMYILCAPVVIALVFLSFRLPYQLSFEVITSTESLQKSLVQNRKCYLQIVTNSITQ